MLVTFEMIDAMLEKSILNARKNPAEAGFYRRR